MDPNSTHKKTSGDPSSRPVERRARQRTHVHLKADVTLPGDLTIVGHTLDISASGLSIEAPYRLEPGQRCEIEINLSKLGGPTWVQLIGEVRRCTEVDTDTFRIGLQFVGMDLELTKLLDAYVWSRIGQ